MNLEIKGDKKLKGTVVTNTSKNAAMGLMAASLLNKGTTLLRQVPKIEEVNRMIEVLSSLGVKIQWVQDNNLKIIPPSKISLEKLNKKSAIKTRSIIMLLGPLIHEFKKFKLPQPGGCKLGRRTVRPHLFALENLGVKIETRSKYYEVARQKLKAAEIVLYESGDTTTENVIMAAAKIPGKTTIKLASANYQVQDLCHFLSLLGVKIKGIGTTTLTINGQPEIHKNIEYHLSEDPIESMFFLAVSATTNSPLLIKRCPIDFLELELLKLEKMNFKFKIIKRYKAKNKFTNLVDIKTYPSQLQALEEKIYARPFPGLNIDNLPFFVPIATQAKGQTLIHDWVYEHRAIYYTELSKLGAKIILADPYRVYIDGPSKLKAAEIICPSALRPATIILIAMLNAKGTSILRNIYSINRGYENLSERLNNLGAEIKII
ncbi:UDP-N-acetylglucosamine 1-carboxyvinyltransferase [Patescibacteria group bacterium]|nr:UDP-N-acetylglucosamine 1-carboxyvinyltransferase [Patescibacteria group bacterium]